MTTASRPLHVGQQELVYILSMQLMQEDDSHSMHLQQEEDYILSMQLMQEYQRLPIHAAQFAVQPAARLAAKL